MISLNMNTSIHDLIEDYLEIEDIMLELGFNDIVEPLMLKTVGK